VEASSGGGAGLLEAGGKGSGLVVVVAAGHGDQVSAKAFPFAAVSFGQVPGGWVPVEELVEPVDLTVGGIPEHPELAPLGRSGPGGCGDDPAQELPPGTSRGDDQWDRSGCGLELQPPGISQGQASTKQFVPGAQELGSRRVVVEGLLGGTNDAGDPADSPQTLKMAGVVQINHTQAGLGGLRRPVDDATAGNIWPLVPARWSR
jgi:hypothetical protein